MITSQDVLRALESADLPVSATRLRPDTPFVDQGLDSLDIANLIIAVESRFKTTVSSDEMARLRTIDDIATFLSR